MKAFVKRLVERLSDPDGPLSRNRHFDALDNPEGRQALRVSRRLRALRLEIEEQVRSGEPIRVEMVRENGAVVRVLLEIVRLKARRTALLSADELELLMQSEIVRRALEGPLKAA